VQSFERSLPRIGSYAPVLVGLVFAGGAMVLATLLASLRTTSSNWSVRTPQRERCTYIYISLPQLDGVDQECPMHPR
jgi:hypothetical protein